MKTVTVLTPTYNRCDKIKKLYLSLINQTDKDFEWLIIDDGSFDNTKNLINNYINENKIKIRYFYKENGGKHTALNMGFKLLKSKLMVIVDSDDYLTNDAIESIINDYQEIKDNNKICALVYKKMNDKMQNVTEDFGIFKQIKNYNDFIINGNIKKDKCEVFKSKIICNYEYPIFTNEKFIGEGVLWSIISRKYDMLFINKGIYVCEYLENGLTKSGRKLRLDNPLGGMYHAKEYLDKRYTYKVRIKNTLLYLVYYKITNESFFKLIKNSDYKIMMLICYIPSIILYRYWIKKYKNKRKK